jgi:hypothetical protein
MSHDKNIIHIRFKKPAGPIGYACLFCLSLCTAKLAVLGTRFSCSDGVCFRFLCAVYMPTIKPRPPLPPPPPPSSLHVCTCVHSLGISGAVLEGSKPHHRYPTVKSLSDGSMYHAQLKTEFCSPLLLVRTPVGVSPACV